MAKSPDRSGSALVPASRGFRRREFVAAGGVVLASGLIARFEKGTQWAAELLGGIPDAPTFTASMLRPDDQLAFRFEFFNLGLTTAGGQPILSRISPGQDAFIVAVFGPQAVAEQAFFEAQRESESEIPAAPPIDSRLAGESRIALRVAATASIVPFNDDSLLSWTNLVPSIAPNAAQGSTAKPRPAQPGPKVTAIEAPYRMILSPDLRGRWLHSNQPVEHDGRTELWHTRLAAGDILHNNPKEGATPVRAIWTPGWQPKAQPALKDPFLPGPGRMTMTPKARSQIVSLTSDWGVSGNKAPDTISARRLMLTSQGAWADLLGNFRDVEGDDFDVIQWAERMTQGREHFVKVVRAGNLFPLGHKAVFIEITERKVQTVPSGSQAGRAAAYLRRRAFVVVKQPRREYALRDFPFRSVEILTDVTPDLDPPDGAASAVSELNDWELAFWPRVAGKDFAFRAAGFDAEGVRTEFDVPLAWVSDIAATNKKKLVARGKIRKDYLKPGNADRRKRPFAGQSVAFAPPREGKSRETAYVTDEFEFGANLRPSGSPLFDPMLKTATIRVPALQTAANASSAARRARLRGERPRGGGGGTDAGAMVVKMAPAYTQSGFNAAKNKAQAYLQAAKETALDYSDDAGDAVGAIGVPNMDVVGLSRTLGPLGGKLVDGKLPELPKLNPADFFNGAKFLGIDFAEVLKAAIPFPDPTASASAFASQAAKVPKQLTETVYEEVDGVLDDLEERIPKEIRTEMHWEPELQNNDVFINTNNGKAARMRLHSLTVVPVNKDLDDPLGAPEVEVRGELTNFGLSLFGGPSSAFLTIYFNRFSFESRNGQKPDVDVEVRDVVFQNALSFVNEIRELMRSPGSSDAAALARRADGESSSPGNGFAIDVTPGGVVASYGVEFPTISVGLFSLQNIALGAQVEVPFNGDPVAARFNFCTAKRPFLLTHTIFGGGGYAEVAVNAQGVEALTVSLEFGAAAAINLGVASGSVQIMGGILIESAGEGVALTGYVRLRGELDVLGLITASLEFNLSLSYDTKTGEAWGRATLTVEVEVLCFSGSVKVTAEKSFAGGKKRSSLARGGPARRIGEPDPALPAPVGFGDLFTEATWDTYRGAFATEAF